MKGLLPLAFGAVAACATTMPMTAGPTAGLGEIAMIDGLRVRPLSVLEDSRCPIDVVCAWAGRVRILAEIHAPDGSEEHRREMVLNEPITVDGGRLTLVGVGPAKLSDRRVTPTDYRFTFAFRR